MSSEPRRPTHTVVGWRCATCGTTVDVAAVFPWRCPRSTTTDRHHVLRIVRASQPFEPVDDPHPFVAFDRELAWSAFAATHGMTTDARAALVYELDDAVRALCGTGFAVTPFARQPALSDALGFVAGGGVWVKDETRHVGGSHKARHLFTVLLHLRAAELLGMVAWSDIAARPSLAMASCGNAAIAAATLAAAVGWPLDVFVPPWASEVVLATLRSLGAELHVCPRLDDDPPGDPCIHRFREAVDRGAIPFSVQGPENALCLDGGRVLGLEMFTYPELELDGVFVQVGGGALATGVGDAASVVEVHPMLHAVQTEGCAPLPRAWQKSLALPGGVSSAGEHWDDCMWPWETEPTSVADGILDDETYDWIGVIEAMARTGGSPVIATEQQVVEAHDMARRLTGIDVSATGTAGLAGLMARRVAGPDRVAATERVAVIFSGVER